MLPRLAQLLSEPVMGFLALVALACGLVPLLFTVSPGVDRGLDVAEWIIVGIFATEYAANLALAEDRRKFALDPWRLLDLVIIVAPLVSLLPQVSDTLRSSPFLRVLRLVRAVLAGTRAGARLRRRGPEAGRPAPSGPPRVTRLRPGDAAPAPGEWRDLLTWAASPTSDWVHASNLEPARIEEIARATGVSKSMIDAALGESSYPRLEPGRTWTALSFSLPGGAGRRDPVLLLATDDDVLSMSAHPTDLHAAIGAPPEGGPWGPRVVIGALRLVLQRHEESVGRFERELRTLEETPAGESGESFFEQTFVLKRRTSAAKADLWRLHGLLRAVAEGRRALPGLGAEGKAAIDRLEDEADYLHETVEDIREGLLTLIDLHLNVASHDANRFMRLLAIVSTLALIPAIVGGLLGMNLTDNPWPVTLGQVAFGTLMVMLGVLYAFLAKGWIR